MYEAMPACLPRWQFHACGWMNEACLPCGSACMRKKREGLRQPLPMRTLEGEEQLHGICPGRHLRHLLLQGGVGRVQVQDTEADVQLGSSRRGFHQSCRSNFWAEPSCGGPSGRGAASSFGKHRPMNSESLLNLCTRLLS